MSDLREALEALVSEWRYTGTDLTPWQEGGGPDPYETALDLAASLATQDALQGAKELVAFAYRSAHGALITT